MSDIGHLQRKLDLANWRSKVCVSVMLAAFALLGFSLASSWRAASVISGVVLAGGFMAGLVLRQQERQAFGEFWSASGLNDIQIDQKWQKLYPSGD